jgi:hypothetical protein
MKGPCRDISDSLSYDTCILTGYDLGFDCRSRAHSLFDFETVYFNKRQPYCVSRIAGVV